MLEKLFRNRLESESRKFFQQHQLGIIDIILFGSAVKGKEQPQDLDLLIIFKEKKNLQVAYELRKNIEKISRIPVDVESKTYQELFARNFTAREALLAEGYSLINRIGFAEGLGYKNRILFHYQLRGKTKSERMRFYYSLYGRGSPGMLKQLQATKYTDTVILCPVEAQEKMREYLRSWKLEFEETPILVPGRLIGVKW